MSLLAVTQAVVPCIHQTTNDYLQLLKFAHNGEKKKIIFLSQFHQAISILQDVIVKFAH